MRKIRIAIAGAGLAAAPHALALNELHDEVEVVGVIGRSRERLERFAGTHRFPVGESFDAVLNDPLAASTNSTTRRHDPSSSGFGAKPMDFFHTAHRELLRDFVAAIRGDRTPLVTGDDALRVQRLIERITTHTGGRQ